MSALELFRFLGEDLNRPPSPSRDPLKRRRVSQVPKTTRYWPGKAPEYANEEDSSSDSGSETTQSALEQDRRYSRYSSTTDSTSAGGRRRAPASTIVIERESGSDQIPDASEENTARDTIVGSANTDNTLDGSYQDSVSGDLTTTVARDRSAIRLRAMAYRKQEESAINEREEDPMESFEEELSESDDDTVQPDHVEPQENGSVFARPIFVPKGHRLTVLERQQLELEELRRAECERQRALERQMQSKELVIQTLVAEVSHQETENSVDLVDDSDELTEKEYELWKIRELKRVIRDRDERTAHERLAAEVERRRNMTEDERLLDDERIQQEKGPRAPRSKIKFLQKYYHKGAFFMDKLEDGSEPIYNRDFNAPTAADCVDKSLMPKSMQVRRGLYGKMGQVKHTHLTAEDTTRFDMPWSNDPAPFTPAGTRDTFDRPSRKGTKRQ
ncbi:micro-fibrillar-associated 1 C-terminus containing protein, putative [Babesia ovis]|uniref:Micro-fibrillar-associated 1 C-terminus containing protein, putative n=1 Tax=Babesia ovis TaxID=5869 RepID=A0A9W5WVQ4_BABOV|nr:micro-fibrillar-associated 1 C-terminus containing protein, putative [Babesia ovis]